MDDARCLCWIIKRNHRVIVAAVAFSPVLRALMRVKRSDVPRTDAEDVGHRSGGGGFNRFDGGADLGLAGQIVAGQVIQGSVEGGESFALVGGEHRSVALMR